MRIFGTPNPCKGEQGIKISTLVSWKWYIGPKDGHHRVLPSPLERHSDHPEWEPPPPRESGLAGSLAWTTGASSGQLHKACGFHPCCGLAQLRLDP